MSAKGSSMASEPEISTGTSDASTTANSRALLSATDYVLLLRLLVYVGDHGGGHRAWPDCTLDSCASCQAIYLHEQLTGVKRDD